MAKVLSTLLLFLYAHLKCFFERFVTEQHDQLRVAAELNTEKMGLWKGGSMLIHAANWNFGQNSNADGTFLAPVNANLLYPTGEPSFAVTSLWYQQELGESGFAVIAGRYDLLDVWMLFYPEYGRGVDGFMNVSSFVPFNIVDLSGLLSVLGPAGDVYGGEFYYNAEINPWFHVSFDLQAVRPSFRSQDTAIVTGLRAKIDF